MPPLYQVPPARSNPAPHAGRLDVLNIVLACRFFTRIYRHTMRTGLLARYSAETLR